MLNRPFRSGGLRFHSWNNPVIDVWVFITSRLFFLLQRGPCYILFFEMPKLRCILQNLLSWESFVLDVIPSPPVRRASGRLT